MFLCFAVFGMLAAGCSSTGENLPAAPGGGGAAQDDIAKTTPLPEIDKSITATLTLTGMELDSLDGIILLFNSIFPNVTVVKDAVPMLDPDTSLNTKILSGQAGDIIMPGGGYSLSFFKQGIFNDLHEFLYSDSDFNTDDYFMNIIEAYSYNGSLYIIPLSGTIEMLGFNASLLGGNRLADTGGVWELTHALDEAKKIIEQNGVQGIHNIQWGPDWYLFNEMMALNYTEFINPETGTVNIDCAEFIDMLKYIKGLADDGYIPTSERDLNFPAGAPITGTMYSVGLLSDDYMLNTPDYIDIRPLTGKNGAITISSGGNTVLAINKQAADKRLAWEFIKCALSYEAQSSPSLRGNIPINKTALPVHAEGLYKQTTDDRLGMSADFKADEAEVIRQYLERIVSLHEKVTKYIFMDSDIHEIIFEQVLEYFKGNIPAEETAQILQRKISMVMEG
jgi:multiple sugar transport system substrate-binding protein